MKKHFSFIIGFTALLIGLGSFFPKTEAAETTIPQKGYFLEVSVSQQEMTLYRDGKMVKVYSISTSKYGIGSIAGSQKTPLGWHYVAKKIGGDQPKYMIFVDRKKTGKLAQVNQAGGKDLITSRILWLQGLEPGRNKGTNTNGETVDSMKRFIYIHGTAEENLIGQPASHGCIRMTNDDVIELFDLVPVKTSILIH